MITSVALTPVDVVAVIVESSITSPTDPLSILMSSLALILILLDLVMIAGPDPKSSPIVIPKLLSGFPET